MIAVICSGLASNETSSIATSPPKRIVRCSTRSSGSVPAWVAAPGAAMTTLMASLPRPHSWDADEALGADEALARGEEGGGETREHGAAGEGRELGVGRVDAERATGGLVLAQRLPGAAQRQFANAQGEEVGDERAGEDEVIEE